MYRMGVFEYHVPAMRAQGIANASGLATVAYDHVPHGYCWYVERYSVHCPTANSAAQVFVTNGATGTALLDPGYRVDYTTAGSDAVGDSNSDIYVPAGYHLVIQFTGATNNDVCVCAIQYAVHQLQPLAGEAITSGQDIRQLAEAHTYLGETPLTWSAVGPEAE